MHYWKHDIQIFVKFIIKCKSHLFKNKRWLLHYDDIS